MQFESEAKRRNVRVITATPWRLSVFDIMAHLIFSELVARCDQMTLSSFPTTAVHFETSTWYCAIPTICTHATLNSCNCNSSPCHIDQLTLYSPNSSSRRNSSFTRVQICIFANWFSDTWQSQRVDPMNLPICEIDTFEFIKLSIWHSSCVSRLWVNATINFAGCNFSPWPRDELTVCCFHHRPVDIWKNLVDLVQFIFLWRRRVEPGPPQFFLNNPNWFGSTQIFSSKMRIEPAQIKFLFSKFELSRLNFLFFQKFRVSRLNLNLIFKNWGWAVQTKKILTNSSWAGWTQFFGKTPSCGQAQPR